MKGGPVQKKIRKESSVTKHDATQNNEITLDSNNYLTYDVLRIVFQYLNDRDLASAANVCRYCKKSARSGATFRANRQAARSRARNTEMSKSDSESGAPTCA